MAGTAGDVFEAVKVAWNAGNLTLNGPYFGEKKKGVDVPYVVFLSVSNSRVGRTVENEYWGHRFRFVVRDKTTELAAAGLSSIADTFDEASLDISPGGMVSLDRVGEGYHPEDEKIFVAWIEYECVRHKPR